MYRRAIPPMSNFYQNKMVKNNIETKETALCSACLLKLSYISRRLDRIEQTLACIKGTLNFKETREYLGLSDSQLYKLTRNGDIPYYKPSGKLIYFNKTELDAWICHKRTPDLTEDTDDNNGESDAFTDMLTRETAQEDVIGRNNKRITQ